MITDLKFILPTTPSNPIRNWVTFSDIGNLQGFEHSNITNIVNKVPGRSGAFYITSDYERRRLSWEGLVNGRSSLSSGRASVLRTTIGALKTLAFDTCDGLSLQVDVELNRIVMPAKQGRSKYLFEAIAPDYRLVSQALNISSTQITVVTGGTTLPTALPISFSSAGGTPSLTVNNAGNVSASPTFTILGPGTTFIVQNQTTGESFTVDLTLLAGETVVVDVANRTVTKGTTNQYGSFSGDFWELDPGDNEIFFNATSGSTDNTLLTINYRDSYNGV